MRKFKPNTMVTFLFFTLEILVPFSVGMPLMGLLMGQETYSVGEILSMILALILVILALVIFAALCNLIIWPFSKYQVFLDEDSFSREGTRVWYRDVTEIVLDTGEFSRHNGGEPCCLDCYGGDRMLVSISQPSLVMSYLLIKRCKHAKVRYRRIKGMLIMWAVVLLACMLIGLYGRFGGSL